MNRVDHTTVVGFGEALWDALLQGKRIGGALLNVAYHLCKLGTDTVLISRVGEDQDGKDLEKFLQENKMDCSFLQKMRIRKYTRGLYCR